MYLSQCQYCSHGNPLDAKFCSECGAPLHLIHCPQCGAVNQITSIACYQCHGALPGKRTGELIIPAVEEEPAAAAPAPSPRRGTSALLIAVLGAAAIALPAYLIYRGVIGAQAPLAVDKPVSAGPVVRATPQSSGTLDPKAATPQEKAPSAPPVASNATSPPASAGAAAQAPSAPAVAAAARPEPPAQAKPASRPVPRRQAAAAPSGATAPRDGKPAPNSTSPCTAAVAALGLCTP